MTLALRQTYQVSLRYLRALLRHSAIVPSHAQCTKVQDAYSLRCAPQVHGACKDGVRYALEVLVTEANARHKGVARVLLADASRRARQSGATRLTLRSHRRRDDAHAFYRALGFEETHLTFDRPL